jgi:hypothetical protein
MLGAVRLAGTAAAMAIKGPTDSSVFQTYGLKVTSPTFARATSWTWTTSCPTKNEQILE